MTGDVRAAALDYALEREIIHLKEHVLCMNIGAQYIVPKEKYEINVVEPFYQPAHLWQARGAILRVAPEGESVDQALLFPSKQRTLARAELATALQALRPDGDLLVVAENRVGAKTVQADLARLCGGQAPEVTSKHKCRLLHCGRARLDQALAADWQKAAAPQAILDGQFYSQPGLFSWDRVDPGSALLAAHLPDQLVGQGADFGCGWGWLSHEVLQKDGVTHLHAVDADQRAIALTAKNIPNDPRLVTHWHDLRSGTSVQNLDWLVMNPPFHSGAVADIPLGLACLHAAAEALKSGGSAFIVANRHLPYELELKRLFRQVRPLLMDEDQRRGYKLHHCVA